MTPLDLLANIFGQWTGCQWRPASFDGLDVDLMHLESAIHASNLTDREKTAVIRRYLHHKKFKEIAREMNLTTGRIQQIVPRGVRRLRALHNLRHLKRAVPGWFNHHR